MPNTNAALHVQEAEKALTAARRMNLPVAADESQALATQALAYAVLAAVERLDDLEHTLSNGLHTIADS